MSPETRSFLDGVRHADDPTAEDERRVLAAVYAAIGTGALVGGAVGASKATKISALFGISGLKLGSALVGLGALTWTLGWALPGRDTAPVRATDPSAHSLSVPAAMSSIARPIPTPLEENEKPPARPKASNEPRPRHSSPASLREEIALLADVQTALARGDGASALARLDGHVTTDRQLRAERLAARILALCSLGREVEARNAAMEFLRDDPASVQLAAVERSCAGTKRSGR